MTQEDRAQLHSTLEAALPLPADFWGRKWSYTGGPRAWGPRPAACVARRLLRHGCRVDSLRHRCAPHRRLPKSWGCCSWDQGAGPHHAPHCGGPRPNPPHPAHTRPPPAPHLWPPPAPRPASTRPQRSTTR
jgi:hypothetical protein